jgi:hypothetical protein
MTEITRALIVRVGVDLAKNVIQVHAVDGVGRRVVARAFKREQFLAWCAQLPAGCLVAMEACAERVNDFAAPGVMNLLCRAAVVGWCWSSSPFVAG